MQIGHAKTVKNIKKASGPSSQEADVYVDLWVDRFYGDNYETMPLRFTIREFNAVAARASRQRDEITPLADQPVDPYTISAVTFMAGVVITLIVLSFF